MVKRELKEQANNKSKTSSSHAGSKGRWFGDEVFRSPFSLLAPAEQSEYGTHTLKESIRTVDVFENNGDVVVKAELPGIRKEAVRVECIGQTTVIIRIPIMKEPKKKGSFI
jgi:HSP20 family molecular chaperone IbpA